MTGRIIRFPPRSISLEDGRGAASRVLATPLEERPGRARDLQIEEPETLLALSGNLREMIEVSPERALEEAEFLYRFIREPKRPIGVFDERDYFMGECALIAGTSCRFLFRKEDARRWFDRAEASFRHTVNAVGDWARVSYQRLALKMEERRFDEVLELLPSLVESFKKLEMQEDALKCRFLEGAALKEFPRLEEAVSVFMDIRQEALALSAAKLVAGADANLIQLYAALGKPTEALRASQEALPIVQKLGNRVALGKLQWGIGDLLREQAQIPAAIEAYRTSQSEFREIGLRADVAALHLVLADLLLELNKDAEARTEIGAALPVIEAEGMLPEGQAAMSLLRESLRQRVINRQALRDLHGYFDGLHA